MLLNIPAALNTQGVTSSKAWRSDRTYSIVGLEAFHIPGTFVSGAFVDDEQATQYGTGATLNTRGDQSSGNTLVIGHYSGNGTEDGLWTGDTSGAIFQPDHFPVLAPFFFVYVDEPGSSPGKIIPRTDYSYDNGTTIVLTEESNGPSGSQIKTILSANPSFVVPENCKSWTLRNISGAPMYYRQYLPTASGNTIDTPLLEFDDPLIVGQCLNDGESVHFRNGDFTPGTSYIICADTSADEGAVVEFNY